MREKIKEEMGIKRALRRDEVQVKTRGKGGAVEEGKKGNRKEVI